MKVAIGGDRFLVVRGGGVPKLSEFPPLPEGFSGWIYVREGERTLYYFNYLGRRVPFCGNATRVLGYLLLGGRDGEVEVDASGPKRVIVRGDRVGITLRLTVSLRGDHSLVSMEGVRHVVFPVEDVLGFPLREAYLSLVKGGMEYHLNAYSRIGDVLFVRTWEYGYPYEPMGCATGTLSAAADFILRRGLHRVRTLVRSGDEGEVSGDGENFTLWHRIETL